MKCPETYNCRVEAMLNGYNRTIDLAKGKIDSVFEKLRAKVQKSVVKQCEIYVPVMELKTKTS